MFENNDHDKGKGKYVKKTLVPSLALTCGICSPEINKIIKYRHCERDSSMEQIYNKYA